MNKQRIYKVGYKIGDKGYITKDYGNWYQCEVEAIYIKIFRDSTFVEYQVKYNDAVGREQHDGVMSIYSLEEKDQRRKQELAEKKKRYEIEVKLLGKQIKEISKTEV